ncbi:MAG TPA: response regulator [Burkholderiaceae bacterium]|jgi:excisionase family DNA binding protein|nr:response regulator [Burkholderiaceae bacterium]HPH13412.1 response regulator [Burkholderiaceae bacterium]
MSTNSAEDFGRQSNSQMSTIEAARALGLAVRSVQLMVDRGELEAWKTPGGHRRISQQSVDRWRSGERKATLSVPGEPVEPDLNAFERAGNLRELGTERLKVLLIEDSVHFQNLITLLLKQKFPTLELRVASDGIAGLAMVGQFQPDVLMVDILLPGIDGVTLIGSLRSHQQFRRMEVIVVTSLDAGQIAPYAFALEGVPVVHKPRLVADLPPLLTRSLEHRKSRLHRPA